MPVTSSTCRMLISFLSVGDRSPGFDGRRANRSSMSSSMPQSQACARPALAHVYERIRWDPAGYGHCPPPRGSSATRVASLNGFPGEPGAEVERPRVPKLSLI